MTAVEQHGPYAVRARRADGTVVPLQAVESISDAQAYVSGVLSSVLRWPSNPEASHAAAAQLWSLPVEGGAVGPLPDPDGTVIEVARVPVPFQALPGSTVNAERVEAAARLIREGRTNEYGWPVMLNSPGNLTVAEWVAAFNTAQDGGAR